MKPHFASFSTPPLGFKHVIDYEQNSAVWEHVCHEGFQRKKQPVVVLDMSQGDSTCKSIDGCCLSSILSCLSTSMFPYVPAFQALPRTKVKMTLKRGLDFMLFRPDTDIDSLDILLVMLLIEICIHWKRMKREQAQNTLPSLAKKFVAIFKFRPLSVTFGFTF